MSCFFCRAKTKKGVIRCKKCYDAAVNVKVIYKSDGFVRTQEFNENNVDSVTGEVVRQTYNY